MEYVKKYYPTTQKELFHTDKVACIRKWIKDIEVNFENNPKNFDFKKILLIHGPLSCGKTTNVNILFKNFSKININIDELKFNEKMSNILDSLVDIGQVTLVNLGNKNKKAKNKKNIIIIDEIEISEKNIKSFIESVHSKYNIPIVLVQNNVPTYKLNNCTFIEFNHVSLLELSKLILKINEKEMLELNKKHISIIIKKSDFDLSQVFSILEFMDKTGNTKLIEDYLENVVSEKDKDIDLLEKLNYIYGNDDNVDANDDTNKNPNDFDYNYLRRITETDSQLISNNIYQNYLKFTDEKIGNYVNSVNIIDSLSHSSIIMNSIYNNQLWELYPYYVESACIIPVFNLNKDTDTENTENTKGTKDTTKNIIDIVPFKDISYNYLNSLEELKKLITENNKEKLTLFSNISSESLFIIMKMISNIIEKLNDYFDKCKKGKNTSKKEKFILYKNILKNDEYVVILNKICNIVFSYKLFEIDQKLIIVKDYILNENNGEYDTECQKNFFINYEYLYDKIDKLDLRILKRLINIACLNKKNVVLTTNTETALKINIFEKIIKELYSKSLVVKNKNKLRSVNEMVVAFTNLNDIFKKQD